MSNSNPNSSKPSPRHSPVPPTPTTSKLPRFLQKQSTRDRSKSITAANDPSASTNSLASGSSASSDVPPTTPGKARKSKFLGIRGDRDKERRSSELPPLPVPPGDSGFGGAGVDDPPVIVEPVSIPRSRTRSERPAGGSHQPPPNQHISLYASTSSTGSRMGDLPTRLSGWFSHTFSTSSTDLSLPSLLSSHHSASTYNPLSPGGASPRSRAPSALLTAAKHGKGQLDKAVRYLLDSDSTPDKCRDPIWILGVEHPGYEPPPPLPASSTSPNLSASTSSVASSRSSRSSFRSSTSSYASTLEPTTPTPHTPGQKVNPSANWPPVFYADFTSRVWLTYRSHFTPIRDIRLGDLPCIGGTPSAHSSNGSGEGLGGEKETSITASPMRSRPWNWVTGGGGTEKAWTSDSGWGCMLRTGQSLLASALMHLHLGRDWRRPPHALPTSDYAQYVQILTWFFDTPAPEAPFSVHRMALAGKELGTDVGQWFGPSTAAGAIKTLVTSFPEAGLGVSVATDGMLFQSDVFSASHTGASSIRSPRRHIKALSASWGDRPVLLLIGVRLGLDGVNPIYYETIKLLYTFPQSVGIAGGRPSSSYYFVGTQADNLFYLDPHHARPAVPLRPPPPGVQFNRDTTPESDYSNGKKHDKDKEREKGDKHRSPTPKSPSSTRTGSSFSHHAPLSPSPLQQEFSTSSASASGASEAEDVGSSSSNFHSDHPRAQASRSPPPSVKQQRHSRFRSSSHSHAHSPYASEPMDLRELSMSMSPSPSLSSSQHSHSGGLDPVQEHYVTAYHAVELKTFHCERVRKMPLSGLDPSMLIGFLCKDEADWWDFRRRVEKLPKTVFSVQDEPPTWPSDSDDNMGLESISEPDDLDMDLGSEDEEGAVEEDDDDDDDGEKLFDTRSVSASVSSASASGSGSGSGSGGRAGKGVRAKSEEVDTEEDPVDPITPLPNSRFSIPPGPEAAKAIDNDGGLGFEEGDIEDDWVDPSIPTPLPTGPPSFAHPIPTPAPLETARNTGTGKTMRKSKKGRKGEIPVPVPVVAISSPSTTRQQQEEHYPFPVTQRTADESSYTQREQRSRNSSTKGGKRMHTARARDGGRTQSGGVKGILTDEYSQG